MMWNRQEKSGDHKKKMNLILKFVNNLYKMNDKHADNTYNILSVIKLLNRKDLSLLITKELLCHFPSINANVGLSDIYGNSKH